MREGNNHIDPFKFVIRTRDGAYVHVFFLSAPLFAPALKGWAVLYPEFRLKPFIDLYQISTLFFLTILPYTAATILPSWLAATADADSAMRS